MKIFINYNHVETHRNYSSGPVIKSISIKLKHYSLVFWPNGKPCFLVNEWLSHIAKTTTGNTVGTYASQITFLVRYCHDHKLNFLELTNDSMFELTDRLLTRDQTGKRNRNNNTVRGILQRCFMFLDWVQTNTTLPDGFTLIGEASGTAAINIKIANDHKTRRSHIEHECMPPKSVPESEKFPITDSTISILENHIGSCHRQESPEQNVFSEYLYERRTFSIWMLKRFGLRPSELVECSVADNIDPLKTRKVQLPTMKRRRDKPVIRTLPLTTTDALRFSRYLRARCSYINLLNKEGVSKNLDAFLLTADLSPLKVTSLTKEFYRLKTASGLNEHRVCMSMFRHRFITREVIVALREFMSTSGATRDMLTESAIFALLRRISLKTGHADPNSLWPYVAIAWASMDMWESIDNAIDALQAADAVLQEFNELPHLLRSKKYKDLPDAATFVKTILQDFLDRGLIHYKI
ncbi:hypothetical protein [Pseudomonas tolaasii]|uniref:hypothetical protein n=1 Tax=Pseudomonas tolaasii TaxID=29442 RepID=UPI00030F7F62|nr:hypothetical protein [Pseudomonas tolaasii]